MQVDITALLQGIYDARNDKKISPEFANEIIVIVREITYSGPVRRPVCDYDKLLIELSKIETERWWQLSFLWKYLGDSLSSGITAANA